MAEHSQNELPGNLQALYESCKQGATGDWEPSVEGFEAMAESVQKIAKQLGFKLREYVPEAERRENLSNDEILERISQKNSAFQIAELSKTQNTHNENPMNPSKQNQTETKEPLKPITPKIRKNLLKVFRAPIGRKTVSEEIYEGLKPYLDRSKGGMSHPAYLLARYNGDKELIKEATDHQIKFAQNIKVFQEKAIKNRDLILKALKQKPAERGLTDPEFKQVAPFLDRKKGGLKHVIHVGFEKAGDKEVLDQAKIHRGLWQEHWAKRNSKNAPGQEQPGAPLYESKTVNKHQNLSAYVDQHAPGLETQPSMSSEPEPGD